MKYKDRKVWVVLHEQVQKVNDNKLKQPETATTQDPKIQEEIHRWTAWFMVLNSAVIEGAY